MTKGSDFYQGESGRQQAEIYEGLSAETLHGWLKSWLPQSPALILDVGAGSGRDAAWFADMGFDVLAVEPSLTMLEEGRRRHQHPRINWVQDGLPALDRVYRLGSAFDVILLSAVWMHVPPGDRPRAFRKLFGLLKEGGMLALTLRSGAPESGRGMYEVTVGEIENLARQHGGFVVFQDTASDLLKRSGLTWVRLAIRLPDDGTGALPLLRHVILNDAKSSTYKLGLLRTIAGASDVAPGMASHEEDEISIPLGLVALNWLRLYKPLVDRDFPQSPKNRGPEGLSFAKQGWDQIRDFVPMDLRVGGELRESRAGGLHRALRDVANTIVRMPVRHITLPGSEEPVFRAYTDRAGRAPRHLLINRPYLESFGTLKIPLHLWRALSRHNCWIDPALTAEWIRLMESYAQTQGRDLNRSELVQAMTWAQPSRDVHLVRRTALEFADRGRLFCVWTGKRLRDARVDIDHCMPWTAWPCDDLWNLLPADREVNQRKKKDRLPSAAALEGARERILDWWNSAYINRTGVSDRFFAEAHSSLPVYDEQTVSTDIDNLFGGLQARRRTLRIDQRVNEWTPA